MSEPIIAEDLRRRTAGHGYEAGCECDLEGGDPECKTEPPYETVSAYIDRLVERTSRAEDKVLQLANGVVDAVQKYCERGDELEALRARITDLEEQVERMSHPVVIKNGAHGVTNLRGPLVLKHGPLCIGCQQVRDQVFAARRNQPQKPQPEE